MTARTTLLRWAAVPHATAPFEARRFKENNMIHFCGGT
jgi:hypothetical protein